MAKMAKRSNGTDTRREETDLAGWDDVDMGRGPKAWWIVKPGAVITGELISRVPRRRKEGEDRVKYILGIKVSKPTKCIKEKEEYLAETGEMVYFDERSDLESVGLLANDSRTRWAVFIRAEEKVKLNVGSAWNFTKKKRALGPKPKANRPNNPEDESDDVPF